MDPDTDPGGQKTCGSYGSGSPTSCYLGESDGAVLPLEEIHQLYIHPLHAAQLPNNPVSCEEKQYTGDIELYVLIRHKDRLPRYRYVTSLSSYILQKSSTAVLIWQVIKILLESYLLFGFPSNNNMNTTEVLMHIDCHTKQNVSK
jgi:hypothetical protein